MPWRRTARLLRSIMIRILALTLAISAALLVAAPTPARACQQRSMPLSDAVALSNRLVLATVVSSKVMSPPRRGRTAAIVVRVRVKKVIAGVARPGALLMLGYSELMPIRRRGMTRCPLWIGSGVEFGLKPGDTYYFLLRSGLVRAVPVARAKNVLAAWAARHWNQATPARVARAPVVMRARVVANKDGSKYQWTTVRPIKLLKNASGNAFKAPFDVAYYGTSPPLRRGIYTLYLVPYAKGSKHWKLLGGTTLAGASHYRIPNKKRAPAPAP